MKARTALATLALTAGLAFTQTPAQAIDTWYNVRPVSKPVSVTTVIDPTVQLIRPVTTVKACFKGKKLVPCLTTVKQVR